MTPKVSMRFGADSRGTSGGMVSFPLAVELGGTGSASVANAFLVQSVEVRGSSTSSGGTYNLSKAVTEVDGYAPICICGWASSGMTYLTISNCNLDEEENIRISGRNLGNSAVTPVFSVLVLYARSE